MTKKLLNKTTATLLVYCIVILLVFAPVFYFLSRKLYLDEMDETLKLHKKEFFQYSLPGLKKTDIADWNRYNWNYKIIRAQADQTETLATKVYYDKLEDENEPYRVLNTPLVIDGDHYIFQGRANMIETRDIIKSIALLFLLLISLLLIGILFIYKISSAKLWRPFYATLDQITEFEIDKNKKPQFTSTGIFEFDRLNQSLERLTTKNLSIYKNQREFIENAAHELQTPLALFQTKIDSLYQMNLSADQSVILSSLNDDVGRLNRLNKNLLLLSKIDHENYFEKQQIILNDAVTKHLDFFTEQAMAKNISIATEFMENITVEGNPELVEIMINNLFLNAIRHNVEGGRIVIFISNKLLSFSNTGGPSPLDDTKIFSRFAKLNSSVPGNGLGLAIVKKVAELNGWQITYRFSENLHRFAVNFQ